MLNLIRENPNLILGLIILTALIIALLISIKRGDYHHSYKKSLIIFGVGIIDLIVGIIFNSIEVGRWDKETITSYLFLKTDNLILVIFGYVFLVTGVFQFLVTIVNRFRA